MKYILVVLSIDNCSCSSPGMKALLGEDRAGAEAGKATESVAKSKKLDTQLPFSGVWVNALYVQRIRANWSPRLDDEIFFWV